MGAIGHIIHHPAGRIGVAVGFAGGVAAALMGRGGRVLLCISCVSFIAFWQRVVHWKGCH
jgi:hypothetical protein